MAVANKFQVYLENVFEKVHAMQSDTLKVALSNVAPVATNNVLADITQIAAGNGYTTGGNTSTQTSSSHTTGTYKLVTGDVVFTASGGTMATFRYSVFYNDTPTSPADPLITWYDYGSAVILLVGETFTWDADPTNGVITAT